MRARALSDETVASVVGEGFVCAWEKKGSVQAFRIQERPEELIKLDGNLITYVCTPRGEVLHALPKVWNAKELARELEWARELYAGVATLPRAERVPRIRAAHYERMGRSHHDMLATYAFLQIAQLEKPFFETLLGLPYEPEKEIVIRVVCERDFKAFLNSLPRG